MTSKDVLVRWGLHELEGSGYVVNDAGSSGTKTVDDKSHEEFEMDRPPPNYTEQPQPAPSTANDALIAQALQEEFRRLAIAEAAGDLDAAKGKEQESVLEQDWVEKSDSLVTSSSSSGEESFDRIGGVVEEPKTSVEGNDLGHVTVYDWRSPDKDMEGQRGGSATSSTLHDPYGFDDDDRQLALALSEEYQQVDKEVARRLTKLESMKHVPRTNQSFPTYEDASVDHQRLLDRLVMYGLAEQKIKGDGNCQFRALSDQLYRTPEHHKYVRKSIVKQLKANTDAYSNYVPMKYSDYLKNMAKNGEWGDHVTLQAASDYYGVKISLITSFKDTCFIEIVPAEAKSEREIYLSFWAEIHYNSIYPVDDGYYSANQSARQHGKKRNWLSNLF